MGHLYHGYVKYGYVSHNQRVNSTSFSTGDLLKKTQKKNKSLTEKIPLWFSQTRRENPPGFSDFSPSQPPFCSDFPAMFDDKTVIEPWSESHQLPSGYDEHSHGIDGP